MRVDDLNPARGIVWWTLLVLSGWAWLVVLTP